MKFFALLMLVILGAFALLGYAVKSMAAYEEQVNALELQLKRLETTSASVQADLEAARTRIHDLEQSLATVQAARDHALAERDVWQTQVQAANQMLGQSHAEDECLQAPQTQSLGTMLVFVILLAVGFWSFRSTGHEMRDRRGTPAAQSVRSREIIVQVNVPREWIGDYARWARQMQLIKPISTVGQDQRTAK